MRKKCLMKVQLLTIFKRMKYTMVEAHCAVE